MDIATLLDREHEQIREMLEKMLKTAGSAAKRRAQLALKLDVQLRLHFAAEEDVVFPALDHLQQEDVAEALEQHRQLLPLVRELAGADTGSPEWEELVNHIEPRLEDHLSAEEDKLMDALQAVVDEEESLALSQQYQERTRQEKYSSEQQFEKRR